MKSRKLLIMAALCAIAFATNAQTEKGKKILGGNISFMVQTSESYSKDKYTSLNVGPQIGFFVSDNFVIGTSLTYNYNKQDQVTSTYFDGTYTHIISTNGTESSSYGIAPFARYYVNLIEKVKFLSQINVGARFGTHQQITPNSLEKSKSNDFTMYNAYLNPGFVFFPTKKLAIELSVPLIGYQFQKYDLVNGEDSTSSIFSFAASTSPTVGINFHF